MLYSIKALALSSMQKIELYIIETMVPDLVLALQFSTLQPYLTCYLLEVFRTWARDFKILPNIITPRLFKKRAGTISNYVQKVHSDIIIDLKT